MNIPEHKDVSELERISFYYSRPDLRPPRLNIVTRDATRATPGLLFVAPSFTGEYRPDSGPYIFDTNGVRLSLSLSAPSLASCPIPWPGFDIPYISLSVSS